MNIHAAAAYTAHLLTARSTAGHGVHSPLLYSFITEVIGARTDKHIMNEISSLRREMLSDSRVLRVTDLGAGSSVMQYRERSIRQIAAVAALPAREAALLTRIAASLDRIPGRVPEHQAGGPEHTHRPDENREPVVRPAHEQKPTGRQGKDYEPNGWPAHEQNPTGRAEKDHEPNGWPSHEQNPTGRQGKDHEPNGWPAHEQNPTDRPANNPETTPPGETLQPENHHVILELGTSLGISTLALALGAPHKRIVTVEGCPELAATARENLRRHGADNAEVLNMEFSQALSHLKERETKVGMAFIDGNHRGTALIDYSHRIREMGDDIIIMADDIHLNRDMNLAWKSLCNVHRPRRPAGSTWKTPDPAIASLETFRLGILFCLRNLTPGHYRIRY